MKIKIEKDDIVNSLTQKIAILEEQQRRHNDRSLEKVSETVMTNEYAQPLLSGEKEFTLSHYI